jgi:1-acyl-sn-glycerol-3-phosphate acyltransferase
MKDKYRDSKFYSLLQLWIGKLGMPIYFRSIEVTGLENIPKNHPVIFTSNHENALLDALVVIIAMGTQPYSVARASAFKHPLANKFLTKIRMFPVYRMQDGKDNMEKNEELFAKFKDVLLHKKQLLIYPEGDQSMKRRLRPLKKGTFRVALDTIASSDYTLDLKIIPVGVNYEDHLRSRTKLLINFGKPVDVLPYKERNEADSLKALIALKDEVQEAIRPLMTDIKTTTHFELADDMRYIVVPEMLLRRGLSMRSFATNFAVTKEWLTALEKAEIEDQHDMRAFSREYKAYKRMLQKVGLRDTVFLGGVKGFWSLKLQSVLAFLLLPLFLVGAFVNVIPLWISNKIRRMIVKHPNMQATFSFMGGLLFFTIFYFVSFLTLWWSAGILIALVFIFLGPLLGVFAMEFYLRVKKMNYRWKLYVLKRMYPKIFNALVDRRQKVLSHAMRLMKI